MIKNTPQKTHHRKRPGGQDLSMGGRTKHTLSTKREFSAGGVVFRTFKIQNSKCEVKWLVGKHSGYHKWVLPKGLIESGEKSQEAALREVKEEMGVQARIVEEKPVWVAEYWYMAKLKTKNEKDTTTKNLKPEHKKPQRRVVQYQEDPDFAADKDEVVRVHKQVRFYLMKWVSGDPGDHDWEMEEARWCGFDEAVKQLAFEDERQALRAAWASLLKVS